MRTGNSHDINVVSGAGGSGISSVMAYFIGGGGNRESGEEIMWHQSVAAAAKT